MRRHMAETPRFLLATGQHDEFHHAVSGVLGTSANRLDAAKRNEGNNPSFWHGFRLLTSRPSLLARLIGASLAWFMMDFAYYGNTVSSPIVLAAISPGQDLVSHTLTQLAVLPPLPCRGI